MTLAITSTEVGTEVGTIPRNLNSISVLQPNGILILEPPWNKSNYHNLVSSNAGKTTHSVRLQYNEIFVGSNWYKSSLVINKWDIKRGSLFLRSQNSLLFCFHIFHLQMLGILFCHGQACITCLCFFFTGTMRSFHKRKSPSFYSHTKNKVRQPKELTPWIAPWSYLHKN